MTQIHAEHAPAPANTSTNLRHAVATRGACTGANDPDAWFPDEPAWDDQSPEANEVRATYEQTARNLCRACPVRALCLELALHEERELPRSWIHGIRGALAPWERLRIRRNRTRRAASQARKAA